MRATQWWHTVIISLLGNGALWVAGRGQRAIGGDGPLTHTSGIVFFDFLDTGGGDRRQVCFSSAVGWLGGGQ